MGGVLSCSQFSKVLPEANIRTRLRKQRNCKSSECDGTVQTSSGKTLYVHKAVLASCSNYFKERFFPKMREESSEPVKVMSVSSEVLEIVIDYMYDEPIALTSENIDELTEAAKCLQIADLTKTCRKFDEGRTRRNLCCPQPYNELNMTENFPLNADMAENRAQDEGKGSHDSLQNTPSEASTSAEESEGPRDGNAETNSTSTEIPSSDAAPSAVIHVKSAQKGVKIAGGDMHNQTIQADQNITRVDERHTTNHITYISTIDSPNKVDERESKSQECDENVSTSSQNRLFNAAADTTDAEVSTCQTQTKLTMEDLRSVYDSDRSSLPEITRKIADFLENYKLCLTNEKIGDAKLTLKKITSIIEHSFNINGWELLNFAEELQNAKRHLKSIPICVASSFLFKQKRGKEGLGGMVGCVWRLWEVNLGLIYGDVSMKWMVKHHVIPLMRDIKDDIETMSSVDKEAKCDEVGRVLGLIGFSEALVDKLETAEQAHKKEFDLVEEPPRNQAEECWIYNDIISGFRYFYRSILRLDHTTPGYHQEREAYEAATDGIDEWLITNEENISSSTSTMS